MKISCPKIFLLLLVLFFLPQAVSAAQTPQQKINQPDQNEIKVDEENVSDLIDTLENKASREKFIKDLKTLVKAEQKTNKDKTVVPLSQKLGISEKFDAFLSWYRSSLEEQGLNSNLVNKSVFSAITLLLSVTVAYLIRLGSYALRNKLHRVQNKYGLKHKRFKLYTRLLRHIGYLLVALFALFTLNTIWNFVHLGYFDSKAETLFIRNIVNIGIFTVFLLVLWELTYGIMHYYMGQATGQNANRMITILPVVRNILFALFAVIFLFYVLYELGVNIIPLLAGAGVVGIAVGFGAQTVIKDFFKGMAIIIEDLIEVGDFAKVGERLGKVEKITIRKIQLRDWSGVVHTVPFSHVDIVENWTKDYSYYLLHVGVAYREDPAEVIEHMKRIVSQMQEEDDYKDDILEPLEIFGLDRFADSALIIMARIKTTPGKQWQIGREFNKRLKYSFDENEIEIPYPHQTLYFGKDKDGSAAPAHVWINNSENRDNGNPTDKENEK